MTDKTHSGLNIDLGNLCSKDAFAWAKKTFPNRIGKAGASAKSLDGAFSNLLRFDNQRIGIASDGIGTKIELAERTKIYNTLGYDLVAMVVDDLATAGFEPTNLSNIIDVNQLDRTTINQLMQGLHDAANFCSIAISGGEIAELGNRIGGYGDGMHFNWCSTAIGILSEKLEAPINGTNVNVGDTVIALQSNGFRSNGFSLLRKIMQQQFGDDWHDEPYDTEKTWGEILLTPCLIYAPLITKLTAENLTPHGIAHITGGGIADNLSRVLKAKNVGAILDNLFEPLAVMKKVIELGKVEQEAAYLYWNMGNGMLLIVPEEKVEATLQLADALQYTAQVAGRITETAQIKLKQ